MESNVLKDISIGQSNYRICKLSAKTGSWLLMQLMGKLVKIMHDAAKQETTVSDTKPPVEQTEEDKAKQTEESANAAIQYMLMNMDEDAFNKVQRHALSVCYRLELVGNTLMPMPIITNTGAFAIKELEFDIQTVMELTSRSLFANLSPFFSKDRLMGLATG